MIDATSILPELKSPTVVPWNAPAIAPVEPVPFVDLKPQYLSLEAEIRAAIESVFEKAIFVQGTEVTAFEEAFAEFCQTPHCVSLHSGTAALHLALLALGIGPGDEVITVPNTFVATAEAISFCGAIPRFVDVDPVTRNMDVSKLEAALTPNVKAIIPVHLYGCPADMVPILEFVRQQGLKVIEDACQAHGALYHGKPVGGFGDIGCFSFYPGKNLGAAGEGGAIVTHDPDLAERVRLLREHGAPKKYEHKIIGHNFRLDTLQAAILNVKLPHLATWNKARRLHAEYYTRGLHGVPGLTLPAIPEGCESAFHLYVVEVANRNAVMRAFQEADIQYGIHYPTPVHLQPGYGFLGHKPGDFPVTEGLSRSILSLPMYAELNKEHQDRVIHMLTETLSQLN